MQSVTPGKEYLNKWPVFFLVAAGVFLSTMDSSMVNVALPSIMRTFAVPLIQVQWVVLVYLLSITVTLLLWGIAADRYGTYIMYLIGVGVFMAASLACSMAPGLGLLIAFRLVEGLGAAMMMSAGPALIRTVFPREQLGKGLGLVGISTSAGLMSGPIVSGFLISSYSWRMIFLVSVPLCFVILLSGIVLYKQAGAVSVQPLNKRLFDWKGALLWATLVISLILYGNFLPVLGGRVKAAGFLWLLLVLLLFIWAEKNRKSHILPLHLFGKSYYHIGMITAALSFCTLFVILLLMPFYLDYIKHLSADVIGLVMMAVPLTIFIVAPSAGMLFDRLGSRYLTTGGLLLSFLALLLLITIDENSGIVGIAFTLALLGMGQSMFLAPNTASLLSRIHDVDAGITSGLLATSRNLGMLVGAAFAGIVFAAWFSYFSSGGELREFTPAQVPLFIQALRATFSCTAAVSLVSVFISWQREK